MAIDPLTAGLLAVVAFDAAVYFAVMGRAEGDLERRFEPLMLIATGAGIALALVLGGRAAAFGVIALLWVRAGWDALHLGGGNVLSLPLPRDYPLAAMVVKAVAGLFFALFALPA